MTLSESCSNQAISTSSPIAQIIPGRLYFTSYAGLIPKNDAKTIHIDMDEQIHYDAFYDDFGPLNLAVLYRFCQSLNAILQAQRPNKRIFLYTSMYHQNRVNAAYLIASYMIIYHNLTAEQAYLRIQSAEPPSFIGYRDAALGPPSYLLHVQHVIQGIEKALKFKWLDFDEFDPDEYEYFERVENGDLNWIVPGKVLSFCGPHDKSYVENGYPYHSPEVYFDHFRANNVTTIIRLNKKIYEAKRFTEAGFEHYDLFFIDGSTPSDDIVLRFIEIVDSAKGSVAIHCKAGLGRTGTLIACWMMKHFRLSATQCMGWLRVCRPGSVIGPQQHFLIDKQAWCWRLGRDEKSSNASSEEAKPTTPKACQNGKSNEPKAVWNAKEALESETAIDESGKSQGDRLCQIKANRQQRMRNRMMLNMEGPSPPAFVMPPRDSSYRKDNNGGAKPSSTTALTLSVNKYSSATTPIKQLKLMSTTTNTNNSRMGGTTDYTGNTATTMMSMQTRPAPESLLRNLRSTTNGKSRTATYGEVGSNGGDIEQRYDEQSSKRRSGTAAATKIPIQKVSVSTSNTIQANKSTSAVRASGSHRKHFSSSRLLKPYMPTAGGHLVFNERTMSSPSNGGGAEQNIYHLENKLGVNKPSSATTSFGRALKSQYARINAATSSGLQPSSSSSQIHQQVCATESQQQFNSPVEGPLAHQTNCKYELRPRNQLHLPSRFIGNDIGRMTTTTGEIGGGQRAPSGSNRSSSPFALSRHHKGSQSSTSFFSRL